MKPFQVVEHTSEIGLEIRGKDLDSLFLNAAQGLMALYDRRGKVRGEEEVSVRVRSSSAEALLVHWLSELVYLVQTKRWLFADIEFSRLQETSLTAVLRGEPIREGVHHIGREIKAVTYHDLAIVRDKDALRANVLFDV